MQAITVRDRDAGLAGLSLTDMPYPHAAKNDVCVAIAAPDWTSSSTHRKPAMPACQTAIRSPRANPSRRLSIWVRLNPRVESWSRETAPPEVFLATNV
jgi:hypothetical protein